MSAVNHVSVSMVCAVSVAHYSVSVMNGSEFVVSVRVSVVRGESPIVVIMSDYGQMMMRCDVDLMRVILVFDLLSIGCDVIALDERHVAIIDVFPDDRRCR